MTSRLARTARYAVGTAAPASAYLYTHPEAREPTLTAAKTIASTVGETTAPVVQFAKNVVYSPPSQPLTDAQKSEYLQNFTIELNAALSKYGPDKIINKSEQDQLLKNIYYRALHYATEKGYHAPTTLGEAQTLLIEVKKSFLEKTGNTLRTVGTGIGSAAMGIGSAAKGVWSSIFGSSNSAQATELKGGRRSTRLNKRKRKVSRKRKTNRRAHRK